VLHHWSLAKLLINGMGPGVPIVGGLKKGRGVLKRGPKKGSKMTPPGPPLDPPLGPPPYQRQIFRFFDQKESST
jgi:hypothetical protein